MNLRIHDRKSAEAFEPPQNAKYPYYAISISTPGDKVATLKQGYRAICRLVFDDVEDPNIHYFTPFTEREADQVIEFVDKFKWPDTNWIIHCDAGISRSAAIAEFIAEYVDEAQITYVANPPCQPNQLVKYELLQASGMRDSYQEFWNNQLGD